MKKSIGLLSILAAANWLAIAASFALIAFVAKGDWHTVSILSMAQIGLLLSAAAMLSVIVQLDQDSRQEAKVRSVSKSHARHLAAHAGWLASNTPQPYRAIGQGRI